MKNKMLFFAIALCLGVMPLSAQNFLSKIEWAAKVGGGIGNYTFKDQDPSNDESTTSKLAFCYQAGVTATFPLGSIGIESGLIFEKRAGGVKATLSGGGWFDDFTTEDNFHILFLRIPIHFKTALKRFYVSGGPDISICMGNSSNVPKEKAYEGLHLFSSLEAGYAITEKISLGVDVSIGITDLSPDYFNPGTDTNAYELVLRYSF